MNHSHRILSRSIATLLALAAAKASAANLIWDANALTAPNPFEGAGTWTTATTWWNGATDVTWVNANNDTAVFGIGATMGTGIPGAIAFTTAVTAGGLDFEPYVGNAAKYNVAGGTGGVLTLAGATPTIAVNTTWVRPFAAINAILAGTAGFDVTTTGNGILEFGTQANTFTGGLRLQSGAQLSIAGDLGLGAAANSLTFSGTSTLITRTAFTEASTHAVTIANGSTAKFDSLNGQTLTLSSAIAESGGAGSLQKEGLGGLTLNTGATYTGETRIRQGTLTLNFANVTAPVAPTANLINSNSALRMFGGTLAIIGKASTANTQGFNGLALDPGASSLTSTAGATGGTTAVNFGAIARNAGATLNVATIAAGTSYSTSSLVTNGILGGYATVNNADWLTLSGSNFAALAAYQTGTDATLWVPGDNVSLANNPTVPLAADSTINSLKLTGASTIAIPAVNTLTIGSGGVLVTTGAATISGGSLKGAAGADLIVHQNSGTAATISATIANNAGSGLTKTGTGTLVVSGANTYAGNTFLNAGILDVNSDGALGVGTTLTARAGTTLRISGASAFSSVKNFQFDFGSNSFGGTANGANGAGANFTVDVTNSAGATISGAFNVSAGTMTKTGAGTLTLANGGINQLTRLNGGLGFNVSNGGLVFNGGAGSEYRIGQAELTIGDNTALASTVTLQSGTLSVGSFTSIGRGNGTTGLQSGLTITGGTFNGGNLFTGFANGLAGYNAKPFVTASNGAIVNVSDSVRIAESAGSDSTYTFSNTSQLNINNSLQVGFGGKGTLRINDSAIVTNGQLWLGGSNVAANTGAGVIIQTGGSLTQTGVLGTGTSGDWRIGGFTGVNDAAAYGSYTISAGTLNTGARNFQIGSFGRGVLDVSGAGIVNTNNNGGGFPVVGRQTGSFGLLNVSGSGAFNQNGTGQLFIVGESGTGVVNLSGGSISALGNPGGAGTGGGTGGVRLGHSATGPGSGTLNLNGGTLTATGIAESAAAASSFLYLNGGTVRAGASNTTFMQGLDNAGVGPNGALFDTNGNNITVNQALAAPAGNGMTTIPVLTGGSGYMGQPIVQITGGGTGATAIANMSGGAVTSITITNRGINYTAAPTINLLGGGFVTAATLDAANFAFAANDPSGGLTKSGAGTLTLGSAANNYGGPTKISGGTLSIPTIGNGGAASTLGAASTAAANLVFDGGTLQYTGAGGSTDRDFTIVAGKTATVDVSTLNATLTLSGSSAATNGSLTKIGNGTLSLTGLANSHTGTTTVSAGILAASGTYPGGFAVGGTGRLTAQNLGVGTLTVPTLSLGATGGVDFEFGTGNDVITIGNAGGLTLGTTALNLFQEFGTTPFTTNGTYTLFDYNTAFTGSLTGAFSITNSQVGKIYSIANNATATTIELTINDAVVAEWTNGVGDNLWTMPGNWNGGIVPNGNGAVATFGLLATPSGVLVNGPKTAGSIVFDNDASYTINGPAAITLNNGLGVPSINVTAGGSPRSHTIAAPIALSQNANLAPAATTTLNLSGNISGTVTGLTVTGAGTVVLSGINGYTGPTTISAGTLEIAGGASIGGSSGLTEKNGAVFRVNSGGVTTITQPVTLDLAGGTATAVSGLAGGIGNFAIELSPGTFATLTGPVANAGGSLVIRGGGGLTLTNAGASVLSNVAGLSTVVQDGSLTLNGGALATYAVTAGELTIGDNTPNQVSVTLSSGTLNVGTFTSVGRGNGTTGLQSSFNMTGGTLNTANLFSGFANGVGGYNAAPAINLSGGIANVTTTRIGESAGANATMAISGSSTFTGTGEFAIGFGGNAVVTIADTAVVSIPRLGLGFGNNGAGNTGAGVIRQTGGTLQQLGGFPGDWRIGGATAATDSLAYGSHEISNGIFTTNRNFQIGAFGRGVMDIRGATASVTTTGGFPVVGRFAGGFGLLNISAGTFNESTAVNLFIIGEAGTGIVNVSGGGALTVAGAPGAAGNLGGTGGIRLGHVAGGAGGLNMNGGTVTASGIAKSAAAGSRADVYFNGGTLKANASNTTFLQGLDSAIVGPGGAFIHTNGNDITIAQDLSKPTGNGITNPIALLDGGTGYIGQPIVQIVGDGFGATAIATVNGAGVVTGITVTNPGIGYTSVSAVNLLGGGFATPASVDLASVIPGANVVTGGVTKDGSGTLTLTGAQNYASLTTNAGRTNLNATLASAAINNVGGILNVNASATNSTVTVGATTVFTVDQTLAALIVNAGGVATLGGPAQSPAFADGFGESLGDIAQAGGASVQAVPEPGSAALILGGIATLLGLRRRRS